MSVHAWIGRWSEHTWHHTMSTADWYKSRDINIIAQDKMVDDLIYCSFVLLILFMRDNLDIRQSRVTVIAAATCIMTYCVSVCTRTALLWTTVHKSVNITLAILARKSRVLVYDWPTHYCQHWHLSLSGLHICHTGSYICRYVGDKWSILFASFK
jgi:hypothetical protein